MTRLSSGSEDFAVGWRELFRLEAKQGAHDRVEPEALSEALSKREDAHAWHVQFICKQFFC